MTFYHFLNCLALAYAPYFVVYRSTSLAEENLYFACVQAGFAYAATQICKMVLLAGIMPNTTSEKFILSQALMRAIIDTACSSAGMHLILKKIRSGTDQKILAVATGWSFVNAVVTFLIPLWMDARGPEFEWAYIQMSLNANVKMISTAVLVALIWMALGAKGKGTAQAYQDQKPFVIALICITMILPVISEYLVELTVLTAWTALGLEAAVFTTLALGIKILYERNKPKID